MPEPIVPASNADVLLLEIRSISRTVHAISTDLAHMNARLDHYDVKITALEEAKNTSGRPPSRHDLAAEKAILAEVEERQRLEAKVEAIAIDAREARESSARTENLLVKSAKRMLANPAIRVLATGALVSLSVAITPRAVTTPPPPAQPIVVHVSIGDGGAP